MPVAGDQPAPSAATAPDRGRRSPGTLWAVPLPQLRSPLARAVVPVLGGAALIAVIGLFTWAVAAIISRGDASTSERLAPSTFRLGSVESIAAEIEENGPLLIPGLNTTSGERSIVVDHTGSIDSQGWRVYWAHPADRDWSCPVEQVRGTPTFTDCDGRTVTVDELAPPTEDVRPIVENQRTLILDLRGVTDEVDDEEQAGAG
jgi:hypothetical protein